MADVKEYKVPLQPNTVKKLKEVVGVGTKVGEVYTIKENRVYEVEDFLEYPQINVVCGNIEAHIEEPDYPKIITTAGPHDVVTKYTREEEDPVTGEIREITVYSGVSKVNVNLEITQVTDTNHIDGILQKGVDGYNNIFGATVSNKSDTDAISKTFNFTIFDNDPTGSDFALNLTRADCVNHYHIDEADKYKRLSDIAFEPFIDDGADNTIIIPVKSRIIDPQTDEKYPKSAAELLIGSISVSIDNLNELLANTKYEIVERKDEE